MCESSIRWLGLQTNGCLETGVAPKLWRQETGHWGICRNIAGAVGEHLALLAASPTGPSPAHVLVFIQCKYVYHFLSIHRGSPRLCCGLWQLRLSPHGALLGSLNPVPPLAVPSWSPCHLVWLQMAPWLPRVCGGLSGNRFPATAGSGVGKQPKLPS